MKGRLISTFRRNRDGVLIAAPLLIVINLYVLKLIVVIVAFFTAVVIKVNVLTESMEGCLNQQLRQNFEFNLVAVSICMTAAVALALVVTVLVAVHQLVRAARAPVIKLRSTSGRPKSTLLGTECLDLGSRSRRACFCEQNAF